VRVTAERRTLAQRELCRGDAIGVGRGIEKAG
jgi:hypothetical protein